MACRSSLPQDYLKSRELGNVLDISPSLGVENSSFQALSVFVVVDVRAAQLLCTIYTSNYMGGVSLGARDVLEIYYQQGSKLSKQQHEDPGHMYKSCDPIMLVHPYI